MGRFANLYLFNAVDKINGIERARTNSEKTPRSRSAIFFTISRTIKKYILTKSERIIVTIQKNYFKATAK